MTKRKKFETRTLLCLDNLIFRILFVSSFVSDFDIRISDFVSLRSSDLVWGMLCVKIFFFAIFVYSFVVSYRFPNFAPLREIILGFGCGSGVSLFLSLCFGESRRRIAAQVCLQKILGFRQRDAIITLALDLQAQVGPTTLQ